MPTWNIPFAYEEDVLVGIAKTVCYSTTVRVVHRRHRIIKCKHRLTTDTRNCFKNRPIFHSNIFCIDSYRTIKRMKLTQMTMVIREFDFTEEVKPVNMEITINPTFLSTVAL